VEEEEEELLKRLLEDLPADVLGVYTPNDLVDEE
jgi:hypothetical protein